MASSEQGVPVAPSLEPALESSGIHWRPIEDRRRIVWISALAVLAAVGAVAAAEILVALIAFFTSLCFHGHVGIREASPVGHELGLLVVLVPVLGGLVVGLMARFGSSAIRGHGIPEAMERVLRGESRISPRITLLKPVSAAVSIGTGGPFGAEGPIIATGGALGSLLGQALPVSVDERKVLLASGAAAGMAAIFGTPVAAVLLAIELLLFEYRARSLVPVALAASTATALRIVLHGATPVFPMASIAQPTGTAIASYVALGAVVGLLAVAVTRTLYRIEDAFERLPVHWMWWPAIGAVVVGLVGFVEPRTMGVGYDNIVAILAGDVAGRALLVLVALKLVSWLVALGSGTSGGTLAPLFTIGGGAGALLATVVGRAAPGLDLDPRVAALVGMAAIFAGSTRALLASVVFAFETTRQPLGLLPLLAGCTGSYLVSLLLMRSTIMTERLSRRGLPVESEYSVDHLSQVAVRECFTSPAVVLDARRSVADVRAWLKSGAPGSRHQGFPVVAPDGRLVGLVTAREVDEASVDPEAPVAALVRRRPVIIFDTDSARSAADHMLRERVGRLIVVARDDRSRAIGVVTRSDLLEAHARRLRAATPLRRADPAAS